MSLNYEVQHEVVWDDDCWHYEEKPIPNEIIIHAYVRTKICSHTTLIAQFIFVVVVLIIWLQRVSILIHLCMVFCVSEIGGEWCRHNLFKLRRPTHKPRDQWQGHEPKKSLGQLWWHCQITLGHVDHIILHISSHLFGFVWMKGIC